MTENGSVVSGYKKAYIRNPSQRKYDDASVMKKKSQLSSIAEAGVSQI
jgi:hypothetical protein